MAFVAKPIITITFTFRDNDGKESTTEVLLPGATTAAAAITFATSFRALLVAVSDAVCISMNILLGYYENAIPTIPSSDIENKGVLLFNSGNGLKSSLAIPSILEAVLQANNQDIDQSHADVSALLDAMTLGLAGTQPVNASGSDLVSMREAYKQNRKSHLSGRTRKG